MRNYSVIVVNPLEKCAKDDKPAGTLYQYDYGQRLVFGGVELPEAYEVHFSNQRMGNSVTVIGDVTGVDIPDAMLLTGQDVHVWLYLHQGEADGETVYYARIAVRTRAKPTHEEPTPVQQDEITQAIAALNAAVESTEADAAAAEASASAASAAQAAAEAAQDGAESAMRAAEAAQTGAETADAAAEEAQEAAEDARDRAEAAAAVLEECSAEAETLSPGADATASYSDGVFHFGIPKGAKGNKGDKGDKGDTGDTGPQGETGPQGPAGQDGADGQDGYTPQRGTDYWTAEDQAVIISAVEDAVEPEISEVKSAIDAEIEGITPTPFIDWPQTEIDSGAQQRRTMYFVRNRIRQVHSASGASTSFRYFGMCKSKIVVADSVDAMDGVLSQITESDLMTLPETAGRYRIRLTGRIASDGGDTVNFPTFYLIYLDGSTLAYTQIDSIPATGANYAFAFDYDGFSGRKFALGVRSKNAVAEFTAYVNFIPVNVDAGVVTVSGSTPSITGESGKRYICGTVDSISITPPGTGIIDVVFSSGTTPTVLTATGVTWPSWFDPNSLNASTTYEISIMDGYGAVMMWT